MHPMNTPTHTPILEMGRTNGYGANYLVQTPLPGQDKADRQRPHGVYFLTNT